MNELKPDVIRALECCDFKAECDDCPYVGRCWDLNRDAIALLREKDAEIERLNDTLADALVRAEVAKVETITEFAERLKRFYSHLGGKTVGGSVEYHIEQVKKELLKEERV